MVTARARITGGESFETVAAETRSVEGIRVRVATPAALYRLKKDTVRPLDRHPQPLPQDVRRVAVVHVGMRQ